MKNVKLMIATAAAFLAAAFTVSAQDVDPCMLNLSYYQDHYKQNTKKERHEALRPWREAYKVCKPGIRQNLYLHGATLYRMLINENAKNPEYKAALIDTLITLDKQRAEFYPKYADKAYVALAGDVHNFLLDDAQRTYDLLTESFAVIGATATPITYVDYMMASIKLYKDNKQTIDNVLENYEKVNNYFDQMQQTDTTIATRAIRQEFENQFISSGVATCDNLVDLFTPRFEQNKDDYALVSKIAKLLGNVEGGDETPLFLAAVTQMHALNPNSSSAYYLYRLYNSKGETKDATKYLEEACAGEDVAEDVKGSRYYELASMYMRSGNFVKTVEAANKSMAADKLFAGKANMIIGYAWMSVTCTGNEIESRSKFWAAYDYFSRAKAADTNVAEEASKQMALCSNYFPATAEAFMYDLQDGQDYQVACGGLRASTKVRTQKK